MPARVSTPGPESSRQRLVSGLHPDRFVRCLSTFVGVSPPPQLPARPSVSVRLPLSSTERLDDLARAMGRRRSDVLRRAVEELLERLANQDRSL
jgi:hypothetical protein